MPYELFEVQNASTNEVLWYEVTFKDPKTFDEYAHRVFNTETLARDYIIGQITNKNNSSH